jgi:hypothetical protein
MQIMTGRVQISGASGEFIASGRTISSSASSPIRVSGNAAGDATITFGDGADTWEIDLFTPEGKPFTKRVYMNAQRYPFSDPGRPGLLVSGDGHGCNEVKGEYTVSEVAYDSSGLVLTRLTAEAIQYCDDDELPLTISIDLHAIGGR